VIHVYRPSAGIVKKSSESNGGTATVNPSQRRSEGGRGRGSCSRNKKRHGQSFNVLDVKGWKALTLGVSKDTCIRERLECEKRIDIDKKKKKTSIGVAAEGRPSGRGGEVLERKKEKCRGWKRSLSTKLVAKEETKAARGTKKRERVFGTSEDPPGRKGYF